MKVNNMYVTIDLVTKEITLLYECWVNLVTPTRWFIFYANPDGTAASREITTAHARELIAGTPKL